MFYYIASKKSKLEVSIVENYSEADLERVFLFIEALADTPEMTVIFKVHPSKKECFKELIENSSSYLCYRYNIQ